MTILLEEVIPEKLSLSLPVPGHFSEIYKFPNFGEVSCKFRRTVLQISEKCPTNFGELS